PGCRWLLIRRNRRTGELAFYRCYAPRPVPISTLVKVAGRRWTIEEAFQAGKGLCGLDQHQVRTWRSWYRWTTLAMLAHAFLTAVAVSEHARQALLVLAYLRKGETYTDLAAGFGVSTTTAWRYVEETVKLLAARAPKLRAALRRAAADGHAHLILDGTLIPIDRVAADRLFYSGKHKKHGMNLQIVA